ncbi:hypothetical protein C8F04DRAFT_1177300 [Mycena alexandri]|uniref:Uncharacterized protein n=1 Tax=Mycena alexandri TaxID=1745969 RepID=A0AAD6T8F8_9AGAR|nr:hypothetical protein C8F04DRAFT_1177300 [Mycena alexandri]
MDLWVSMGVYGSDPPSYHPPMEEGRFLWRLWRLWRSMGVYGAVLVFPDGRPLRRYNGIEVLEFEQVLGRICKKLHAAFAQCTKAEEESPTGTSNPGMRDQESYSVYDALIWRDPNMRLDKGKADPEHLELAKTIKIHHRFPRFRWVVEVTPQKTRHTTPANNDGTLHIPPEVTSCPGVSHVQTRDGGGGRIRGGAHGVPLGQLELPPLAGRRVDSDPSIPPDAPAPPTGKAKPAKGGARKVLAKRDRFETLLNDAEEVDSLSGLATILGETLQTMDAHRSMLTKECMAFLRRIQERLADHHEFQPADDTQQSFSTLLLRAVVSLVKELSTLVEAQQRAIQNLSKKLESVKNAPLATPPMSPSPSYTDTAASKPKPTPRQLEPPLPRGSGECILVHFSGSPPPLLLRYDEIVSLPAIFVSRQAIDGVAFASVESFESVVRQFEELNPTLGKVVGLPRWKNTPPSESRIAAAKRDGRRIPVAGSLVFRLQSKDMVDRGWGERSPTSM